MNTPKYTMMKNTFTLGTGGIVVMEVAMLMAIAHFVHPALWQLSVKVLKDKGSATLV